jgi:predicted amidophosphoribosyltransferase
MLANEVNYCRQCRAPLIVGATYCGHCGLPVAALPAPANVCRQCQSELVAGAAFCGNCGLSVAEALPGATPAAAGTAAQPHAPLPAPTLAESEPADLPTSAPAPASLCPQCQSAILPGDPYCPECGFYYAVEAAEADLTPAEPQPADFAPDPSATLITSPDTSAADAPEELSLLCPHCSSPARPNARFCRHCGQAIQGITP